MAKEAKRKCELCGDGARMYCDSDEASLCWSCDEKVHSANFLVAKHSRTLLCHACCSPTPWTASGAKLCRTVSVCPACLDQINHAQLRRDEGEGEGESNREMGSDVHQDFIDSGSDYDSGYSSDEYEEEEGDENQVVPWSASSSPSSSPPPGPSSSGGDEGSFSSRDGGGEAFSSTLRRRLRDDLDDQVVTSSSLLD